MTEIKLHLEPSVALFYIRIALYTGKPLDQVLNDALFKLAGELSLEALQNNETSKEESELFS